MNDEQLADYIIGQITAQYGVGFTFEQSGQMARAYFCYGKCAMAIALFDKFGLAERRPGFVVIVNGLKAQFGMEMK